MSMKADTLNALIPTPSTRNRASGFAMIAKHPDFILGSLKHLVEFLYNACCHAVVVPLFSLYKQTLR